MKAKCYVCQKEFPVLPNREAAVKARGYALCSRRCVKFHQEAERELNIMDAHGMGATMSEAERVSWPDED